MTKKTKQFIADKYTKKWLEENKDFVEDYQELCYKILEFRMMWGIEIGFILKNSEEVKGRELGVGIVEELFNTKIKQNHDTK